MPGTFYNVFADFNDSFILQKLPANLLINQSTNTTMSGVKKSASKKVSGPTTISLIIQAIGATKAGNKGVSRAAIASWILSNSNKTAGGRFNSVLRRALAAALEQGILRPGVTAQRFKLGTLPKKAKKVVKKKKAKKVTKKKKSSAKKAKKAGKKKTTKKTKKSKKKVVSKKKKTSSKKNKKN